jgi:amino acid transporter
MPDPRAVLDGQDKDPVVTILKTATGEIGFRAVIAVVLVSFISCLLSLQAAASRLLFAYARDQMIIGSRFLSRLSPRTHVPSTALFVTGVIPALIALSALRVQDAVATIISFAAIGIYIAFQMIVLGALFARARGWRPAGPFSLGAWGWPVNLAAFAFGIGAIMDMAWPRSPEDPWYSNYAMIVTTAGVLVLGTLYMIVVRPYERGDAPAGDAHRLAGAEAQLHRV